jgi:hypothetical protein
MPAPSDYVRFLRYFCAAVLAMVLLLWLAAETLLPARAMEPPVIIGYVLYAFAAADAVIALFLRRKFVEPAAEALRVNPDDAQAMTNWMKGQFVPLPMGLGIAAVGLAARVLGVPALRAAPLFVASILLLLLLRPSDTPF